MHNSIRVIIIDSWLVGNILVSSCQKVSHCEQEIVFKLHEQIELRLFINY